MLNTSEHDNCTHLLGWWILMIHLLDQVSSPSFELLSEFRSFIIHFLHFLLHFFRATLTRKATIAIQCHNLYFQLFEPLHDHLCLVNQVKLCWCMNTLINLSMIFVIHGLELYYSNNAPLWIFSVYVWHIHVACVKVGDANNCCEISLFLGFSWVWDALSTTEYCACLSITTHVEVCCQLSKSF